MFQSEDIRHKKPQSSESKSQPKQQQERAARSKTQPKQQRLPEIQAPPPRYPRQENLQEDVLLGPKIELPNNTTIRTPAGTTASTLFRQQVTVDRRRKVKKIERVQIKCHLSSGGKLVPHTKIVSGEIYKPATRKDLERTAPNAPRISPGKVKQEIKNNNRVGTRLHGFRAEEKRRLKSALASLSERVLGEIGLKLESRLNGDKKIELNLRGKTGDEENSLLNGDSERLLLTAEATRQVNLITDYGDGYKIVRGTAYPFAPRNYW